MPVTPDFKERLHQITIRNSKKKHVKGTTWPLEKRIEVVSQWLILGNMRMVAAVTGVGHELIRAWKGQPWWKELENEIRQTQNIEMDTKLSKLVERSIDAVLDRVENGDFIYNQKTGAIIRKPAALRDVHRVSMDAISKRELLRGNATERKETTQVSVKDQLAMLAAEFAKWQGKPKNNDVIDVEAKEVLETSEEIEDALSEERCPPVQEGVGVGEDSEAESSEGTGGEELREKNP